MVIIKFSKFFSYICSDRIVTILLIDCYDITLASDLHSQKDTYEIEINPMLVDTPDSKVYVKIAYFLNNKKLNKLLVFDSKTTIIEKSFYHDVDTLITYQYELIQNEKPVKSKILELQDTYLYINGE